MDFKFDHIGIPTTEEKDWDGFFEPGRLDFTDFTKDEFKMEWVRFKADSPWHKLVTTMPHVAYRVNNLEKALEGRDVIVPIFSPAEGFRVAFIAHNGAPVELNEVTEQ